MKFQPNFDPETQEIFTLDVNSLFPNINNTRTINYILNEVYEAPGKFFVEKNKQGKTLPAPSGEKFRQFLHGVLNSFNIFRCHIGVFSQKKGVKMGSPLSSIFADLFLVLSKGPLLQNWSARDTFLSGFDMLTIV